MYVLRLYIRGKPWLITVDDNMLFLRSDDNLRYAKVVSSLWSPLMEKALAKLKGNFSATRAGINQNGLRMITGAPIISHEM